MAEADLRDAGATPRRQSVRASGSPRKNAWSTRSNTDPVGDTAANSVAQDLNFRSSGEPKISCAERPSAPSAASQTSASRGPRTGWARYASASARLPTAYRRDVALDPSPASWGKTYHTQCDRFRPARTSARAVA
jgi:hypothetical protein